MPMAEGIHYDYTSMHSATLVLSGMRIGGMDGRFGRGDCNGRE